MSDVPFGELLAEPLRNGVSYPSRTRGTGVRMFNMREIFAHDRLTTDVDCERVPLTAAEQRIARLQPRDLLFARQSLTYEGAGKVALVLDESGPTWDSHLIRARLDRERAEPAFYYYFFTSPEGRRRVETIIQQVAAAGIRGSELAKLPVPSPPRKTQRAIAEVLGALDDKIAANTALAATAEATISASYQAAMRGGADETPLLEELVVEFGEPFGGAFFVGAGAGTGTGTGTGRPLIRIRDLKTFDSQVWTTEVRQKEVLVQAGDILVGMDAEFRATPWLGERGLLNQRVMRASHMRHGRALVREVLKRPLAEVEAEKSATTVIHLNKSDLARKSVPIPSDPLALSRFEAISEPLFESRVSLATESRTLAATRDLLLPQLMSGKLRVRDAEAVASGAGA